jgi:uncharacterized protein YbbC (DUF1343 family)
MYVRSLFLISFFVSGILLFSQVVPAAHRMDQYVNLLSGKRTGIVANEASLVNGVQIVDTLIRRGVLIKKIFCPEHGFRLRVDAGQSLPDGIDGPTGIPIVSLYGRKVKPYSQDLKGLDIMIFDIQDVGVRCYTYLSTLTYVMEACAEQRLPLMILDRPNPNGFYIDGPVLQMDHASFVGMHPVPLVYGMTVGEYARMVNGEGWLNKGIQCDVIVIPLSGYAHHLQIAIQVPPSPNLTTMNAIYLYPSLCLFEGTPVSVGRGTHTPFEIFGHPALKGFSFSFTPVSIPGMSTHPPFEGQLCRGLDLQAFYQHHGKMFGRINLSWLLMAFRDLGSDPAFFKPFFDQLAGTDSLRKQIMTGKTEFQIRASWQEGIKKFSEIRGKYLLYPE